MSTRARHTSWIALVLALGAASAFAKKDDSAASDRLELQAFAIDMSNPGGASAGPIDITIERWSTPEERATLRSALTEKGSEALLSALRDTQKVGFIRRTGGGLGWNIQYARKEPLPDGGYRLIFATDRPMSFAERVSQPRSADYELMVAELRMGADGKGEGKLVPAAKVTFNEGENVIEIENYANEPVQLTKIRELGSKDKDASDDEEAKDKAKAKGKD